MWRTSCGDRVLDGKERSLFVHAAACLLDHLLEEAEASDPDLDLAWHTGVVLFDQLDASARIVLLRDVVQALTDLVVPTPKLTAANESAIHAVFRFIRSEIEMEVECAENFLEQAAGYDELNPILGFNLLYWRQLILAAYLEHRGLAGTHGSSIEENLDPACDDLNDWNLKLESLADQILWDRDWELDEILDAPPELARKMKRHLRIHEDYFLALPDEPDDSQMRDAVSILRDLAEEDQGDEEYAMVVLRYDYDSLVGLEFSDSDLNAKHGYGVCQDQEIVHEAEVAIPLVLAKDVADLLKRMDAAQQADEKFLAILEARQRVNHQLHRYLPEPLQRKFWQTFEIAPGISAERDYATTTVEFNLEKFAGVEFDEQTREEARIAAEGLEEFLFNLVMDRDYDFTDDAVRKALIQTAERMVHEFTETEEESEEMG